MKLSFIIVLFAVAFLPFFSGCKTSSLESGSRTLNRDLDLVKSPYQYVVSEDETRLKRVLRKMPVSESAADGRLKADVERAIEKKLGQAPKIAEIRIFETQPNYRREVWVAELEDKKMAFDVVFQPGSTGVNFTVEGPIEIEGAL